MSSMRVSVSVAILPSAKQVPPSFFINILARPDPVNDYRGCVFGNRINRSIFATPFDKDLERAISSKFASQLVARLRIRFENQYRPQNLDFGVFVATQSFFGRCGDQQCKRLILHRGLYQVQPPLLRASDNDQPHNPLHFRQSAPTMDFRLEQR